MTRRLPNLSIRSKLMLIIMLTSSIALLLACVAFVVYDRNTFQQTMVQDLTTIASVIGDNSTAPLAFDDQDTASETLSALRAKPGVIAACLYRKDGRPFAIYHRAGAADEFAPPAVQPPASAFANNRLVLFRDIHLRGERIGAIYIESDLAELNLRLRRYAGIVALILLVGLLVAFLLSSKLQSVISRPLLHLAETARAVIRAISLIPASGKEVWRWAFWILADILPPFENRKPSPGESESIDDLIKKLINREGWELDLNDLRKLVRWLWTQPDLRTREYLAFLLQQKALQLERGWFSLSDTGSMIPLPPASPFESAIVYLRKAANRTEYCKNPECPTPYFFARRGNQRYCSNDCAIPAQRAYKRQWWAEHGDDWRAARKKASKKGTKQHGKRKESR